MEHRLFLQSLSSEQRRSLTRRNNAHGFIRLLVLVCCFLFVSFAIVQRLPWIGLWLLVQGLLLVSLFHLLHECVHDTVFQTRWMNRALAHLCGFLLFLPATWFRYFHHAHHRYTQQTGKDPELEADKPSTLKQWLVHVSGIPVWRSQLMLFVNVLRKPIKAPYIPANKETRARADILTMLCVYCLLIVLSLVAQSTALFYLWILPLVLGQPFLRLYLLAEHAGCELGTNMLSNTRTVLTNPVMCWFTWNMPYHTEHHVYPSVPFHQLPRLNRLMQAHLVQVEPSYTGFNARYVKQMLNT